MRADGIDGISVERIWAGLAVIAYIAAALTVLPSFAPGSGYEVSQAKATVMVAKADRLPTATNGCAAQDWPNISSNCLHNVSHSEPATNVRLVTVR